MSWSRLDLKVGFACNNHCVFCAQGHKRELHPRVPTDELLARLGAHQGKAVEVVLTGGEPTLHPDILTVVRQARQMGYERVQIQTNGRMLAYPKVIDDLVNAGVTEFSPALHAPSAAVHDSLTGAAGSFAQTLRGIRNLAARGLPIITNSVIVKANVALIPQLVTLLLRAGVREMQMAFVHPVGTALELFDSVVPRLPELHEPLRLARELALSSGGQLVAEAMPLCMLRGIEDLCVEEHIPDTVVVDLDGAAMHYSSWRGDQGKLHGPCCQECMRRPRCEGPWREYPEHFGWDEFRPFLAAGDGG